MSDRLALAHAIEEAGIPRDKAENVASVIVRVIEGSVATKADLEPLRADTAAAKAELKAEIQEVRSELHLTEAKLIARIDRTFNRLGALVVVVAGLLFAALHAWPPH